jgi:hypothetical protein
MIKTLKKCLCIEEMDGLVKQEVVLVIKLGGNHICLDGFIKRKNKNKQMNKKQLIKIAKELGIKYYNECDKYICLIGINGHATLLYTNLNKRNNHATMLDFSEHLKQMGRDSLKMELNNLLSITQHA